MRAPVRESWAIGVHEALAGMQEVLVAELVPGETRYELVLTTRSVPPDGDLVGVLWQKLGRLIGREDSPIAEVDDEGIAEATWHFYPPVDARTKELFDRLDWSGAVVLHEFVD